jgi:uncharacterized protein (TIGR02996 family)
MARRVVGERKGEQLFGMLLVGDPKPVKLDGVRKVEELPLDYRKLMTTWGPGVAFGRLHFADPTDPAGPFVHWQRRFHVHAHHLIASRRWSLLDAAGSNMKQATVLASGGGTALVATHGPSRGVYTASASYAQRWSTFAQVLGGIRDQIMRPALYYRTKPSQRDALLAAIRQSNARLADGLLEAVLEEESISGMLALVLALVREPGAANYDDYVTRAMQAPIKHKEDWFADLTERLVDRSDEVAHRDAISRLASFVESFDLLGGEPDPVEIDLEQAVLAKPGDDGARLVLLDHYQERGRTGLAQIVRAYLEILPPELVNRYGRMNLSATTCEDIVAQWCDAWAADDPDLDVAPLVKDLETTDRTFRRAIVNWIELDQEGRLAEEPGAQLLLMLALRSHHVAPATRVLVKLAAKAAAPFLWSALTRPTRSDRHESSIALERETLAIAFEKLGKLTPDQVTEVLSWIDPAMDRARAKVAFCLLQRQAKDDRVYEAALRHFLVGSPYTEKVLSKRKADPRVEEMLWAAFDREEAKVLKNSRFVSYTREYGVLARFLAKLGHTRAKEAYQRFQTKARMDRAAVNRVDWDDL